PVGALLLPLRPIEGPPEWVVLFDGYLLFLRLQNGIADRHALGGALRKRLLAQSRQPVFGSPEVSNQKAPPFLTVRGQVLACLQNVLGPGLRDEQFIVPLV